MSEASKRPPRGIGPAGRRWWDAVAGRFDLEAHEDALLRRVVAVADRITALEAITSAEGLMLDGKVHPAAVETRQCEALLGKLAAQLRIPDEHGERAQIRGGGRGYYSRRRGFQVVS
ncbi:hypothetical protein Acsp06_41500 [Actinomycetospora sp. NBRC 106375]|uniref:hypothetical protein n=1 Tax=Actinomycetospora sp. NBRC 106375 TaxID=3032207 RepID=UPI00249FC869|nr:hypothetical protein [Actinomycetospora sp. NBRC 106375]GLZ47965.1 hypothetical protein Acsp06_41500 [Actinomycetospora sp. NBRC 106375]